MTDRDSAQIAGPQIRIRALREAHGFSVSQLIDRIAAQGVDGVHPDTIRNVELGYKRASKPLITAWAKALGLSSLDVWQPEPLKSSRDRVA
ncbi:helix-turn-helix domain-containing protein [Mycobacteroides abscessus]|nr:helix-turn-helix transcriptional regulator [Mycobacteroides abscessus]MDO3327527.1 helix-turn-helix transcriptional regulator [Mycobacteroides abscessus subsp. abscessus]SHT36037.1 Uncharacterised protein [Mycobacteroides abscessus subsp. abscessus]SHU45351.1 Uncharacterised protein [Mycobacteroides abscessus subsp. abscessus]SIK02640.1 Uncharacterised protein [Mycobacteroides abscessus subsp. abscessus]